MAIPAIDKIFRRLEFAKRERSSWECLWQKVMDVIDPHYDEVYNNAFSYNINKRGDRRIYDSKGVRGNILLQQALHSLMYSPNQSFFEYTVKDKRKLKRNPALERWLADVSEDINCEIQDSNFHPKISEAMQDYTTVGVLASNLETYDLGSPRYGDFIFRAFPFEQIYPFEGIDGSVHSLIREYRIPAYQLEESEEFEKAVRNSDKLQQKIKQEADEPIQIIHYICPKNKEMKPMLRSQEFISLYCTIEDQIPLNMEGSLYRGYEEKPFGFGRWMTRSNNVWPRSPAMTVLGDAESLQALAKLRLTAAALAVNPPTWTLANRGIDKPKFIPGANNEMTAPESMGYISNPARLDVAYTEGTYLANNVDDGFFVNDFQFPRDLPQMTAMEAGLRNAIKQTLFAPIIARSQYDHLKPLAIRMFWTRYRAGYYDQPPIQLQPSDLDISVVSPLAKAQHQNEVIQSEGLLRMVAEIAPAMPEAVMKIDAKKYVEWRAKRTHSSFLSFLRSNDEVEQMMQQQMMAAQVPEGAKAFKDIAAGQASMRSANES